MDEISILISCMLALFSIIFYISSTDILFVNRYYRSVFDTLSSIIFYTSSNVSFVAIDEATSAIVRDTSDTFAFNDKPAFNSDLLALVGITLSSSLIARPYDLITSQTALSVSLTIS